MSLHFWALTHHSLRIIIVSSLCGCSGDYMKQCMYIHYNIVSVGYNVVLARIIMHVITCCSCFCFSVLCGRSKAQVTGLRLLSCITRHLCAVFYSSFPLVQSMWKSFLFHVWGLVSEEVVLLPTFAGSKRLEGLERASSSDWHSQTICSQKVFMIEWMRDGLLPTQP